MLIQGYVIKILHTQVWPPRTVAQWLFPSVWRNFQPMAILSFPIIITSSLFGTCCIRKKKAQDVSMLAYACTVLLIHERKTFYCPLALSLMQFSTLTFHRHGYDFYLSWMDRQKSGCLSHSSTINAWQEIEVVYTNNVVQHMRSTNIILLCQIQSIFWTPRPGSAQPARWHWTGADCARIPSYISLSHTCHDVMVTWDAPAMTYWISRLLCTKAK